MENDPKAPAETTQDEPKNSDAAAITARIIALKGDSDEYAYAEPPPKQVVPVVSPKAKRRGMLTRVLGAVALLLIGAFAGNRLEKRRAHPPVAVINGEPITPEDFAHASEIPAGRAALQRLIDDRLVMQYAKKVHVYPEQKEVDAKFSELTRSPAFFQNLKRANETQEDFKYTLLVTMCKQAIISNGVKVNPSEIKDYYNRNINPKNPASRFYHPESVQAAVIISPDRNAMVAAQKEMAGGMSFAAAALKYSVDVSKSRAGVLPALRRGRIDSTKFPGLEKILFDMQNGNTTDITQIGKNYWIIRCLSHVPETTDPFEKVEEDCTTGLLVERGIQNNGKTLQKQEQDFVKASTITITPEQYADLSPKK